MTLKEQSTRSGLHAVLLRADPFRHPCRKNVPPLQQLSDLHGSCARMAYLIGLPIPIAKPADDSALNILSTDQLMMSLVIIGDPPVD